MSAQLNTVDVALVLFTNFVQSCQRSSAAPGAAMRDAGGSISVHPLSFIKNDNRTGSKAACLNLPSSFDSAWRASAPRS